MQLTKNYQEGRNWFSTFAFNIRLVPLHCGDPLAVFAVTVVFFTWIAFATAVLAWWAEYGSALLLQSAGLCTLAHSA
jgi:hypothetical protein